MSTRAMYQFKDERGIYTVYKHHDGYPEGAAGFLKKTLSHAWKLPRFEADEFAAAFISANKRGSFESQYHYIGWPHKMDDYDFGGGIRLVAKSGKNAWKEAADIEYRYLISQDEFQKLHVDAYSVCCDWQTNKWTQKKIFSGSLDEFTKAYLEPENKEPVQEPETPKLELVTNNNELAREVVRLCVDDNPSVFGDKVIKAMSILLNNTSDRNFVMKDVAKVIGVELA